MDLTILHLMDYYLSAFYDDRSTALMNNCIKALEKMQTDSDNPLFEMTLLQWLNESGESVKTIDMMNTVFDMAVTILYKSAYRDYLDIAIKLITSSFGVITDLGFTSVCFLPWLTIVSILLDSSFTANRL